MSYYDIASGSPAQALGAERRADDVAAQARLLVKLRELQACGLHVEMPLDEMAFASDVVDVPLRNRLA